MMLAFNIQNQHETERLGADIAFGMKPGDLIFLSGDLGAGKTTLARAIIRQMAEEELLEVPSPTYTICQSYETRIPIHHYDLYRLSALEELDELGWSEQLETGCLLLEWPQNVFDKNPENAILINLTDKGQGIREISVSAPTDTLERLKRSLTIREFMAKHGHENSSRKFLTGDASARAYETIGDENLILMNSPATPDGPPIKDGKPYSQIAHLAENVSAFVAISTLLSQQGFKAPKIFAQDLQTGLLVTENFGAETIIDAERQPITERYKTSIALLSELHQTDFEQPIELENGLSHSIPTYDTGAMMIEVELLKDWYLPYEAGVETDTSEFTSIWQTLIDKAQQYPFSLVLRDYHSPNIIWLEGKSPKEQIGLIDFQDALIGPEAYDVASLAQDARVDISENLENELVGHYICTRMKASSSFDESLFRESYAVMSALRVTKILGIFIRLDIRDGKPQYRAHLPRMRDYLKRSLKHPVLAEYQEWLEGVMKL